MLRIQGWIRLTPHRFVIAGIIRQAQPELLLYFTCCCEEVGIRSRGEVLKPRA